MRFALLYTPHAKKNLDKLISKNPSVEPRIERLLLSFSKDPYNLSHRFDIKKLTDASVGQWRIRSGNYRVRYDIDKNKVIIHVVFDRKKGY